MENSSASQMLLLRKKSPVISHASPVEFQKRFNNVSDCVQICQNTAISCISLEEFKVDI